MRRFLGPAISSVRRSARSGLQHNLSAGHIGVRASGETWRLAVPFAAGSRWFASGRQEGTVKMWNEERGFGFITPVNGGEDVFIHRSGLGDGVQLVAGQAVTFDGDYDERKKKDRASNVQLLTSADGTAPTSSASADSAVPSAARSARRHHIVTAAANWDISREPMGPDLAGRAMVQYRLKVRADAPKGESGDSRREEFQICGDGSWDKRFYPDGPDREEVVVLKPGSPGSRAACQPGKGHGRNWAVEGKPGTVFGIFLDPATMMVTCDLLTT